MFEKWLKRERAGILLALYFDEIANAFSVAKNACFVEVVMLLSSEKYLYF